MQLVLALYCVTLLCEVATVFILFLIFKKSMRALRWAWLMLAIGICMMSVHRAGLILNIIQSEHYDLIDAVFSLPIAACLLLGVLGLNKLLLALENEQLLIETLAQFDPLTNSYSRSQILYRISEEIQRCTRSQRSFSLLEVDIDHFKRVNDKFGHPVGDEILIGLVRHLKEVLRSGDSLGRIGGEEFLILLPETDSQGAAQLAERLRAHIESTVNQTAASGPIKITISIGIATFEARNSLNTPRGIILNEIVGKADIAMYEAKNQGRNRIAIYTDSQNRVSP